MPHDLLKGKQLCLRCQHLYIRTEDMDKRICICKNPILVDATRVHTMSIGELRSLPEFDKQFRKKPKEEENA